MRQKTNSTDELNSTSRERPRNSTMRNRNEENSTHESTRTDINRRIARLAGTTTKETDTNQITHLFWMHYFKIGKNKYSTID